VAAPRRRSGGNGLDAWPGYVDALSTLLMVIIFVLLVFVLAQGFLSVALSGRDQALDRVNRQLAELSDMLSLERGKAAELGLSVARLTHDLDAANAARVAGAQELTGLREEAAKLTAERDALRADKDRAVAVVSDADLQSRAAAARLAEQTRALAALRDELEKQAREAAARSLTEQQLRAAANAQLADEKKLSDSARAQIALLNRQLDELRAQMTQVSKALDLAEASGRDKDVQIANLGQRLNAALAAKVEELQRYRSEFYGKLREVLAGRPGIQVVGDRFVFQSEVLFPAGSAELTPAGQEQIIRLAATIREVAEKIPPGVNWLLRVDGHADHRPISGGAFASNWELSAARAITVVKLLIEQGVPPERLAATGFGDNQPLDDRDAPDAYAKNRRIELRLTDR
jgi:chemotaxis protein MotB